VAAQAQSGSDSENGEDWSAEVAEIARRRQIAAQMGGPEKVARQKREGKLTARERIAAHERIRDDLITAFRSVEWLDVRTPEAGSYLFPRLPALDVPLHTFVHALRLQAGVTVTPGTEFSPDATDSVRLNFSQNHQAAVQAVKRLTELTARYRAKT